MNAYPMLAVDVLVSVPLSGQERISFGNYFGIEKRRQCRKLAGQTSDLQISAQIAVLLVNMLQVVPTINFKESQDRRTKQKVSRFSHELKGFFLFIKSEVIKTINRFGHSFLQYLKLQWHHRHLSGE